METKENKRETKAEEKEKYIKLCPKCRSINVKQNQQGGLAFFGLPTFYTCQDCKFTNNFFPEVTPGNLKKLQNVMFG